MKSKIREFLNCLTLLPIMALVTVTFPVWAPIVVIGQWISERRHRYRMSRLGRFASWRDILQKSEDGSRGTLIFEQAQKTPLRVWWTPDDSITTEAPEPAPSEADMDYLRLEVPLFMRWLHERYTAESGSAILTDYKPLRRAGFAKISDFESTGFSRIISAVRLS